MTKDFKAFMDCVSLIGSEKKDEQFSQDCQHVMNWKSFIDFVRWHKVTPLVYNMLSNYYSADIPCSEMMILKSHCDKNSLRVIKLSKELLEIAKWFQAENLSFISFKGPLLTHKIYAQVTLREPRDLDLLIAKDQLLKAHQILTQQGYELYFPKKLPRYLSLYTKYQKDFSYYHPLKHIFVDLHWRLFNNPHEFIYPINHLLDNPEIASLSGISLPKMPKEIEFLYLLHHGAMHSWARLCWLYDVKQYLTHYTLIDWDKVLDLAKQLGIERSVLSGLALAHQLLGVSLHPIIHKNIHQNKVIHALTKTSSLMLTLSKPPGLLMRCLMLLHRCRQCTRSFPYYKALMMRLVFRIFKFIPA